jgi:hypothetical protein
MEYLGDPSTDERVQFYPDGFELSQEKWFPPGVKGPLITSATISLPRIAYARLLLFELNHDSLRLVPEMEVKTVAGERLVLRNNLERILSPDIEQVRTEKKFYMLP